MDASLNQPRRVEEEGSLDCKLLLSKAKKELYALVKVLDE